MFDLSNNDPTNSEDELWAEDTASVRVTACWIQGADDDSTSVPYPVPSYHTIPAVRSSWWFSWTSLGVGGSRILGLVLVTCDRFVCRRVLIPTTPTDPSLDVIPSAFRSITWYLFLCKIEKDFPKEQFLWVEHDAIDTPFLARLGRLEKQEWILRMTI